MKFNPEISKHSENAENIICTMVPNIIRKYLCISVSQRKNKIAEKFLLYIFFIGKS